jgi:hypothetical protein
MRRLAGITVHDGTLAGLYSSMYKLIPTPGEDPTIPLVNVETRQIVASFNKRELAIALGMPDARQCPQCRETVPLVVLA